MVNKPIQRLRIMAVFVGAFPSLVLVYPVTRSEIATIITVAGIR